MFKKVDDFEGVCGVLGMISHSLPLKQEIAGIISHPLVNSVFVPLQKEDLDFDWGVPMQELNGMKIIIVDESVSKDADKSHRLIKSLLKRMEKYARKDTKRLFTLINKPYRLLLLSYSYHHLSEKTFNELLRDLWITTEYPIQHPGDIETYLNLWKKTSFEYLYPDKEDEADRRAHENFSSPLKIYRGLQGEKAKIKSLSWTISYDVAHWFANRWNRGDNAKNLKKYKAKKGMDGIMYEAEINFEDIFFYTNARYEQEVIVNPRKLKKLRRIENG